MSSQNRVDDSPNHFMVMDAIARGLKNPDKISRATNISKPEVESITDDLVTQRLAVRTEKKGLLGGKKVELGITDIGLKLLNSKKAELQKEAEKIQRWYNSGNTDQLQGYMDSNRAWIPMMMFSGIMNAMFFMSMMSMMGAALTPAESIAATDAGADTSGGGADVGAGADAGGGGADAGDAGGGGDFGGGDFGGDFGF